MSLEKKSAHDYTIKIITDNKDNTRSFHISSNLFKYGIISAAICILLMLGGFTFAGYTFFTNKASQQTISELQKANAVQQEQLTGLAQKATQMQNSLDKLNSSEQELKSLTNITVPTTDDPSAQNSGQGGQGGPFIAPNVQNITEVLNNLEKRMTLHQDNMKILHEAILAKREQQEQAAKIGLTTPYGWPAQGSISSPYGFRWNGSDFHPGVDIAADYGTPIKATADGVVTTAGWNSGGYGNMVEINHGHGVITRFGHASSVVVSAGQHVIRGQIIAYVGSTGFSTGPHVHYEVRINDRPVNPAGYL